MAGYDLGDQPRLTFTTQVGGTPTDATVTLTVTRPDGSSPLPAPAVQHLATGSYAAVVRADQAGVWTWTWTATGTVTDSDTGTFTVNPTLYATVAELRAELADATASLDATQLQAALRAASRATDQWCGRRFWQDPAPLPRRYRPCDPLILRVADIATQTGLVVAGDSAGDGSYADHWAAADWELEPLNADAGGGAYCWTRIVAVGSRGFFAAVRPSVQVTARWGWSQVPDPVREATLLKAVGLYKRRDAPFGVAGFGEFGAVRITRQDPDVAALLAPYQLPMVA